MEHTKQGSLSSTSDGTLLVHYGGETYEVPPLCPHLGGPLAQGSLAGPFLRCVWHGATFDVRTGRRLRGPECPDLAVRRTSQEAK